MRQVKNAATARLMYAKYRGVCKCGRGFLAGEQIEFDPIGRLKRCARCIEKRQSTHDAGLGQLIYFDSYSGAVQRLRQISELPRPLAPHVVDQYWKLMREISTAPESSRSVKQFLLSVARCCNRSDKSERYVTTLLADKRCVHCLEVQNSGELVLMEFPSRNVHCIWCECTHL